MHSDTMPNEKAAELWIVFVVRFLINRAEIG